MDVTGIQDLLVQIKNIENNLTQVRIAYNELKNEVEGNDIKAAQDLANLISILQTQLQSKKDQLEAFRDSVKSFKSMAEKTIEQLKILTSKISVSSNVGRYSENKEKEEVD